MDFMTGLVVGCWLAWGVKKLAHMEHRGTFTIETKDFGY